MPLVRDAALAAMALVALSIGAGHAAAQPIAEPAGFTLDDALRAMEPGNPTLAAATLDARAAEGDAIAAGRWRNPSLALGYLPGQSNPGVDPAGEIDWSVSQALPIAGAPAARRRAAAAEAAASREDLRERHSLQARFGPSMN